MATKIVRTVIAPGMVIDLGNMLFNDGYQFVGTPDDQLIPLDGTMLTLVVGIDDDPTLKSIHRENLYIFKQEAYEFYFRDQPSDR